MDFIALDFETANQRRDSACSIALSFVKDNHIVENFYSLINPETEFNWRNVQIHGIKAQDVANAPTFSEIWEHLKPAFNSHPLIVAHNAAFDNSVLQRSLQRYNLEVPKYALLDTLKTSKQLYPNLDNHRLNTICDYLQITLQQHHNALADCTACANILLHQQINDNLTSLAPFIKEV